MSKNTMTSVQLGTTALIQAKFFPSSTWSNIRTFKQTNKQQKKSFENYFDYMNSESLGDSKEFIDYNLETAVQMDPFWISGVLI